MSNDSKGRRKAKPAPDAPAGRRPAPGTGMAGPALAALDTSLGAAKALLEDHAAHLRALDRRRLNGVAIKKQGFIDRALSLALENPDFLPHYVPLVKFRDDDAYFKRLHALLGISRQIGELLWNLTIEAADAVYTDALDFYAYAREAADRRVDAAETIHNELKGFFASMGTHGGEPTAKQLKARQLVGDVNALLRGKRDGKIVVENVRPKATGGTRKVVDIVNEVDEQIND